MDATGGRPRLIIVVGATGVGKTETTLRLASEMGGEIISADSMQVYRLMDIGTAKPTMEERSRVRHHMLDLVYPDERFNASLFMERAGRVIEELHERGIPIFVAGGTGLYIKALLGGLFSGPAADEGIRAFYRQKMARHGREYLFELLKERDEKAAAVIPRGDIVRIIRALEVLDLCGTSIVEMQSGHRFRDTRYEALRIGLRRERKQLCQMIEERTEQMVAKGLVDEVRELLRAGYHEDLKPMRSIGYRHMTGYLKGSYASLEEAKDALMRDTRHYAKRQMTWFTADSEIEWFTPADFTSIREKIDRFLGGGFR